MQTIKRILLKLTGEFLTVDHAARLDNLLKNIAALRKTHQFGIVVGGGNFFRGHQHGSAFGLRTTAGHTVGMLATLMNGTILHDRMTQAGIPARILSALSCENIAEPLSQQSIDRACDAGDVIIFAGGTGNPFFTTDTNAIIRALQMQADAVWKATKVDGIYTADPHVDTKATMLPRLTHEEAIQRAIGIMDATALTLAQEQNMPIRVFNLFDHNALLTAAQTADIGSIIETKDTL